MAPEELKAVVSPIADVQNSWINFGFRHEADIPTPQTKLCIIAGSEDAVTPITP